MYCSCRGSSARICHPLFCQWRPTLRWLPRMVVDKVVVVVRFEAVEQERKQVEVESDRTATRLRNNHRLKLERRCWVRNQKRRTRWIGIHYRLVVGNSKRNGRDPSMKTIGSLFKFVVKELMSSVVLVISTSPIRLVSFRPRRLPRPSSLPYSSASLIPLGFTFVLSHSSLICFGVL